MATAFSLTALQSQLVQAQRQVARDEAQVDSDSARLEQSQRQLERDARTLDGMYDRRREALGPPRETVNAEGQAIGRVINVTA